jgi:hypothetical protein
MTDTLVRLRNQVADHLEDICKLFTRRPKITIVIRTPWLEAEGKDGGVLLSDDDFDLAIAEINRLRDRKPVGADSPSPTAPQKCWTEEELCKQGTDPLCGCGHRHLGGEICLSCGCDEQYDPPRAESPSGTAAPQCLAKYPMQVDGGTVYCVLNAEHEGKHLAKTNRLELRWLDENMAASGTAAETKDIPDWDKVHTLLELWQKVWEGDRVKYEGEYPAWLLDACGELFAHDLCDQWAWNDYVKASAVIIWRHFQAASGPSVREKEPGWKWFGHAGHLCVGQWCRYHLCTLVGEYLISTVGEYWPERPVREIHASVHDPKWLAENKHRRGDDFDHAYMQRFGFENIGCDRKYETFVFKAGSPCKDKDCNCGLPSIDGSELDTLAANDADTAGRNHMELCEKYAAPPKTEASK